MKTVKQITTIILVLTVTNLFSQYSQSFGTPNKGLLAGPCGATAASCGSSDFVGEDWTITGDFSGFDSNDIFATDGTGELFAGGDLDGELCYEVLLDVSAVAGAASLSVDLEWVNHDIGDYVDVDFQLDGGAWNQISNQFGGGTHTVEFLTNSVTGSGTITQGGLVASNTLGIRVCVRTNTGSSGEATTIDDLMVPEAGAMILPVKWAEFNVRSLKEGNQLNWATYTEVNNERFEIEKSVDDVLDFKKIGSIEGAGTSTSTSRYEFLDLDLSSSVSYYRIKQVDFDGRFEYSKVLVVKNDSKEKINFSPNPFSNQLLITSNQPDLIEGTTLRMYNNQGQIVLEKTVTKQNLNEPIETAHLSSGMYFIQYSSGDVVRLVKL